MEPILIGLLSEWLWPLGRRAVNGAATTATVMTSNCSYDSLQSIADNPTMAIAVSAIQVADYFASKQGHRVRNGYRGRG